MDKRNKSTLPGLIISKKNSSSLEGIKNAKGSRGSSALPIMKYLGNVKPSRNERIIKPDMTSGRKVTKQDLPIIREILKPGFSGNFRTNYTPITAPAFDADALAYFTAAGITDATEKDALNQLVLDLKGTGSTTNNTNVWSSLDEIAPISPTSLAAAAYKLKYVDTEQITWVNSPTHSSSGVTFNGSTQYGNFNYIPSTAGASLTSASITLSVNGSGSGTEVIYGVAQGTTQRELYFFNSAGSTVCHLYQTGTGMSILYTTIDRQGVFIASRRAVDDIEGYEDGVSQNTETGTASAGTLPSASSFIAANNDGTGTAANFAATTVNFVARGSGLTDNQAQDLYDAISTYNTALSR